jgi:hypothetical protein
MDFLRSHQLLRYLRISQHFMEPEGLLPAISDYPEPDKSSPYYTIIFL